MKAIEEKSLFDRFGQAVTINDEKYRLFCLFAKTQSLIQATSAVTKIKNETKLAFESACKKNENENSKSTIWSSVRTNSELIQLLKTSRVLIKLLIILNIKT